MGGHTRRYEPLLSTGAALMIRKRFPLFPRRPPAHARTQRPRMPCDLDGKSPRSRGCWRGDPDHGLPRRRRFGNSSGARAHTASPRPLFVNIWRNRRVCGGKESPIRNRVCKMGLDKKMWRPPLAERRPKFASPKAAAFLPVLMPFPRRRCRASGNDHPALGRDSHRFVVRKSQGASP